MVNESKIKAIRMKVVRLLPFTKKAPANGKGFPQNRFI